jgi:hypothetical protein
MQRGRFRRVEVDGIARHVGRQCELPFAAPHRPSVQVEVEESGVARHAGGAP